jgi:hypothetical protein
MAATNFSGPVVSTGGFTGDVTGNVTGNVVSTVSLVIPTDTAAHIADAAAAINASGDKAVGSIVLDIDNNLLYVALGTGATDDWALIDGVGSTTVTPS